MSWRWSDSVSPGKPEIKSSSDRHAGDAIAELEHQVALLARLDVAAHGREHAVRAVLEGMSMYGTTRPLRCLPVFSQPELCDGVDHGVGEVGGVGVHEADPAVDAGFGEGVGDGLRTAGGRDRMWC